MRGAVLWERRTPLVVEEVEIAAPGPGEARVRLLASGVCHSDLNHIQRDTRFVPPLVLGHEGAGVVEAVGPGVTRVRSGDRVLIGLAVQCGDCAFCVRGQPYLCVSPPAGSGRLRKGDRVLTTFLGIGAFAEQVNVDARRLVTVRDDVPADSAALIACGVATGIGAVINTADVRPGSSVLVIGLGGVGLNVVQGARLAGAARIIAADLLDRKLELARGFGATHVVNANRGDLVEQVRCLTGGLGADYAFEVIGNPRTIREAYDAVRNGGVAVVIGSAPDGVDVPLSAVGMTRSGKVLMGCNYGSTHQARDFPRYVELYRSGQIKLDELISRRFALDEINQALAAMEAGEVARGVIVFA